MVRLKCDIKGRQKKTKQRTTIFPSAGSEKKAVEWRWVLYKSY